VVAFGVFNDAIGTEEVVIIAESEVGDPNQRRILTEQIRQRVTGGSDVAVRYVQVVGRGWLLKTSSGKIARSANRDKYLAGVDDPIDTPPGN
jgi:acyl-CoA synthetase (AMP-forming)/AMP-acid ligase II